MTSLVRPLSCHLQWERLQARCRRLYERLPSRPVVLVVLVLLIGALTVITLPGLLQPGEPSPPVMEANESATKPGAQLARAIAAKRTHLTHALHQRPLDPTPSPTSPETTTESDADDDSREGTETDNDDEEVLKTDNATDSTTRADN